MTQKLSGPMLPPRSGQNPRQIMVLLHGYGSDGNDLLSLGQHWGPLFPDMLFIAPNAPDPCAINPFGYEWFVLDLDRIAGRIAGVRDAAPVIVGFLQDLWAQTGLGAADTFLAGFSQGAMMALHVGTSLPTPLRGILAFSGAFVPSDDFEAGRAGRSPVALVHGDLDSVVDPNLSREAAEVLQAAGFEVGLHISRGVAHGISPDGLDFATGFLLAHNA